MTRKALIFLTFFSLVNISYAQDWNECAREEANAAEEEIDLLTDWQSVYDSFQEFAHCDDGAISEGYSDVISSLLADDWENFSKLEELTESDFYFKRFVIEHLDETVPYDVGEKIYENVRNHCPSGAKRLCKLIESQLIVTKELAEPAPQ